MPDDRPFAFAIEPATSPAAVALIAALDDDLATRYPRSSIHALSPRELESAGAVFVIARVGGEPAACGAFRPFEDAAEIKRMFVLPRFRRLGLGRSILQFLEREAARRGFARALLETGDRQSEAIALYESEGWCRCALYGPYIGDPLSVCLEKRLMP